MDSTMETCARQPAGQQARVADKALRDAGLVHQVARQDEEGNRQQRKAFQRRHHLLDRDGGGHGAVNTQTGITASISE
ncbi:hypothetical protein [Mameliella sp. LZ-28]|uniref:hypothetical protein n=1 Tax=Mameliella sp. LZ-28 TaxID=2484146 RepID=UPI001820C924